MGGIDRVNGVRGKWKSVSNIQPNVNLVEEVAVDIQETGKVLCAAAQVKVIGSVHWTRVQQVPPQEIIRNSGLGNAPKHNVFIALVKQPNPPLTVIAIMMTAII